MWAANNGAKLALWVSKGTEHPQLGVATCDLGIRCPRTLGPTHRCDDAGEKQFFKREGIRIKEKACQKPSQKGKAFIIHVCIYKQKLNCHWAFQAFVWKHKRCTELKCCLLTSVKISEAPGASFLCSAIKGPCPQTAEYKTLVVGRELWLSATLSRHYLFKWGQPGTCMAGWDQEGEISSISWATRSWRPKVNVKEMQFCVLADL